MEGGDSLVLSRGAAAGKAGFWKFRITRDGTGGLAASRKESVARMEGGVLEDSAQEALFLSDGTKLPGLAAAVLDPMTNHACRVRGIWEADRAADVAGVWMPGRLDRKYPNAGNEWPWFWLWPDGHVSEDPRRGSSGGIICRTEVIKWLFRRRDETPN